MPWLRPDAKSQVSVIYEDNKPVGIANVVISTQHTPDVSHKEIESFCIENVIRKVLPAKLLTDRDRVPHPDRPFVVGGPQGDTGLTGRKIIVDTHGGMGRHAVARSRARIPTKVDRSAAYMGWVAKNIVAASACGAPRSSSPTRLATRIRSASTSRRSARRPLTLRRS